MIHLPPATRDLPFTSRLSESTLEQLHHAASEKSFAAGSLILLEGEPCQAAYFLLSGEVRIFRSGPDGREQLMARLRPGASFNTVPCLRPGSPNQASARAAKASTLLILPRDSFQDLLKTCPDFTYAMLQHFGERLVELTRLVESLSLHSVRGRLARFLLDEAENDTIHKRWKQDEIAVHLGTVREVIGRTLRSFMDEGYLRRERQALVIIDRAGLEEEARK